jgi:hypothetical protein
MSYTVAVHTFTIAYAISRIPHELLLTDVTRHAYLVQHVSRSTATNEAMAQVTIVLVPATALSTSLLLETAVPLSELYIHMLRPMQ